VSATERLAALDALTDADTKAISTALFFYIRDAQHNLTTGGDAAFWRPLVDDASAALDRITSIRIAS
jgi:hypothetical protein